MPIAEAVNVPWTRKHDVPGQPLVPSVAKILYPTSLEEVIQICSSRQTGQKFHAAGSHWALSNAAISDDVFIETHDPNNNFPAMGATLFEVVPGCMSDAAIAQLNEIATPFDPSSTDPNRTPYFVHVQTGKRVYQLYAELDFGDDGNPESLAVFMAEKLNQKGFLGPWSFKTLGGSGGQTVFGALTTGTHGGDVRLPPIADSVRAMHLVADGGKHYWIEPESFQGTALQARLTDDAKLMNFYGDSRFGGPDLFEIIRDDTLFNAVLMSAGRFGVIYSVVIEATRQYCLHQVRDLNTWQDIKGELADPNSMRYNPRFLQIVISVAPHGNGLLNRCGITTRETSPLLPPGGPNPPPGRDDRVGRLLTPSDPQLNAPRF